MLARSLPSPCYIRQRMRYDPDTGKLYWLPRERPGSERWNGRYAGREAFTAIRNTGYFHGRLDGACYQAHRIAWVLHYGEWPRGQVDHVNHIKTDNRISNLRDVTHQQNHRNIPQSRKNTSGQTGVHWNRKDEVWEAYIMVDYRKRHLGRFREKADAVLARKRAEAEFGFHENHGIARCQRGKD